MFSRFYCLVSDNKPFMMAIQIGCFCALIFCAPLSFANDTAPTIRLTSTSSHFNVSENIRWTSADKSLQLSDIQLLNDWRPTFDSSPLPIDTYLWGKLQVDFSLSAHDNYYLSIGNPRLDIVDIYILDDKNRILSAYLMGSKRQLELRPVNHRLFTVPLSASAGPINIYFKIADDGPLNFFITLENQSQLLADEQFTLVFIGFLCGGLCLLASYFLITYVFLRSPVRFWFSVSCGLFLLLFLNVRGVLSQVSGLSYYVDNINNALFGLLLISAAKVIFAILERVPAFWRYCCYLIGFVTLFSSFIANSYQQLVIALGLASAFSFLIICLAGFYHRKDKPLSNLVGGLSLISVSAIGFVQVFFYLNGIATSNTIDWFFTLGSILSIILLALAIEAHEKILSKRHHLQQQSTISDLQHFYELFRNSAEGLYTSTIDGELVTINPAMCSLFGYQNESEMLAQVPNASAFYVNPLDRELLLGEILKNGKVTGKELKGKRKDGSEFWFSISGQIKEENDIKYMFGSIFDVTERKRSDMSLEFLATHDSLTGVCNRREFEKQLKLGLSQAQIDNSELTLLYLDLDQFKVVNDTCGHKAGDLLIKQLSQKLNDVVHDKGLLARLGGDEFGVLLLGDNAQMAYLVANKLLNAVKEFRFIWENRIFTLGVSIGQVPWYQDIKSPEQLLSMADSACYMAKERGRNQIHTYSFHDQHMQRYESEISWVADINHALQNDCFELYYQHYQALKTTRGGHHYEILIRMRDQENKIIPPNDFLPAAERFNLTSKIDRWVIEHYFKWLAQHPEHKAQLNRANINLSGHSLADEDLKLFILNAFEKYAIPYPKICFEITETMAIIKMEETLDFINTFHRLGCKFSLDDFGSGFSSYAYLKTLPVDQVKIDGSFVKDILLDPIDMAMVGSIKDIAKAMKMETVAEFVESTEILVELGKMGVDFAQGYAVAKPQPLNEFSHLM